MANPTATIALTDFSPGIFSDYHGGSESTVDTAAGRQGSIPANGAATIDSTYRCCSDSSGALVPLPKRVSSGVTVALPGTTTAPTYYPTSQQALYVADAITFQGAYDSIPYDRPTVDPIVSVLYQFPHDPAGTSTYRRYFLGRMFRRYKTSPDTIDFYFQRAGSSGDTSVAPGFLTFARHGSFGSTVRMHLVTGISAFHSDPTTGAIPANVLPLTTFDTDNVGGGTYPAILNSAVTAWPDPANATNESFLAVPGQAGAHSLVGHQGRVVAAFRSAYTFGGITIPLDYVRYTGPNDLDSTGEYAEIGEENTSRIAFLASQSADELLVMKESGGAYMVRGDLNNPTIQRLPYLESTYGVAVQPASTPLGLVYATRNGIFLWAGGDTTEKLSTQVEGFFFRHEQDTTNEVYTGNRGRMDYWHPWVCVPNNYLLDTRTKAWWRLEAPTTNSTVPYNAYQVASLSGKLYAFPYKITATQTNAWDTYDPTVLADSYSWQSQPLVETKERVRAFQQITLVASVGNTTEVATVTVTLTGFDKDGEALTPVATTFTFSDASGAGKPIIRVKDIAPNFNAMYVQVKIVASSANSSTAAPKIHQVHLHTAERARNPTG